ncbi:hypothetical protein BJ742DRAFT_809568 [Cladochytrium replicatum]|nr:hypothetical protein BJ742DRAFT_809568 [Cladochytrium replicatum]
MVQIPGERDGTPLSPPSTPGENTPVLLPVPSEVFARTVFPSVTASKKVGHGRVCEGVDSKCNMLSVPGRRYVSSREFDVQHSSPFVFRYCRVCQKRSTQRMREQHILHLEEQLRTAGMSIQQLTAQQRALRSFQTMAKRLRFQQYNISCRETIPEDVLREVHSFLKLFSSYSTNDNTTCATPNASSASTIVHSQHPTDALVALLNLSCDPRNSSNSTSAP